MPIINQVVKGGGTTPTGTIQITTNGTHDVTNYATADVQVPTTAPAEPYIELQVNAQGVVSYKKGSRIIDLSNVVEVKSDMNPYCFSKICNGNNNVVGTVNLGQLKKIQSCDSAFRGTYGSCINVTAVNLHNLVDVDASYALANTFDGCTNLTEVDIDSLEGVWQNYCFQGCFGKAKLSTIYFKSLKNVKSNNEFYYTLANCSLLSSVWFYALNTASFNNNQNHFNNMLNSDTGVTVHFPMAIQSTIGSWSDVTAGFGGTNTTILYDIVTSLTGADTNTYTRSEKDSTATATAWKYNDVLYYTSGVSNHTAGVNEPTVGDTIYSDDACTTAVTTISAIA